MAIDFDFIRQLEGFHSDGKVPTDENGDIAEKAGVTVGSGVDLGQWSKKQLENIGVPSDILDKVSDYFGKKGTKAIEFLTENPLQLEEDEALTLTDKVKRHMADKTKKWYNKNNSSDNDWSDLTDRQQTAITSVAYQYGVGSSDTPNFNEQVLTNNWEGLVEELRDFKDDYATRRHKELQYLVGTKVDGDIGSNTEAAIAQFKKNPMQQSLPQEAPEDPVGSFLNRLTQGISQRLEQPQREPQVASKEPTEPEVEEEQGVNPFAPALAKAKRVRTASNEAGLEREFNEARLAATAEEAEAEEKAKVAKKKQSIAEMVAEAKRTKRATGTRETERPVFVQERGDDRGEERDPTFGIF